MREPWPSKINNLHLSVWLKTHFEPFQPDFTVSPLKFTQLELKLNILRSYGKCELEGIQFARAQQTSAASI
jgi:hypothetical protein